MQNDPAAPTDEPHAEAEAMLRKHAAMYDWTKAEARAINDFILTVRFGVQEELYRPAAPAAEGPREEWTAADFSVGKALLTPGAAGFRALAAAMNPPAAALPGAEAGTPDTPEEWLAAAEAMYPGEKPARPVTMTKLLVYGAKYQVAALTSEVRALRDKAAAYDRINTPEIADFLSAVENEALHQRERWGVDADGGKEASDWFWLVGYLAGKALHDVKGKRLHHLITTAAALLNWHGQETGNYARMRPGIDAARLASPSPTGATAEQQKHEG